MNMCAYKVINKKEKVLVDLEDLKSEYESTYLAYVVIQDSDTFMNFKEWLKKEKDIVLVKKKHRYG